MRPALPSSHLLIQQCSESDEKKCPEEERDEHNAPCCRWKHVFEKSALDRVIPIHTLRYHTVNFVIQKRPKEGGERIDKKNNQAPTLQSEGAWHKRYSQRHCKYFHSPIHLRRDPSSL